jgi:hypothetical protein
MDPRSASRVTDKNVVAEILAEREKLAAQGTNFNGDTSRFNGLTLLQREALLQHFQEKGAGRRRTAVGAISALSDPDAFDGMGTGTQKLIDEFLTKPEVIQRMETLRQQYPNTYLGMNTGTLGTLGSLFANFGKGTRATLHGKEAIVTPKQLQSVIGAGTQISVKDVVNRLNNNINLMISVAKEDVRLERSKLMAMT